MLNNNPNPDKPATASAGQGSGAKSTLAEVLPYALMAIGAILILVGAINMFTVSGILLLAVGYVLYKSSKGELKSLIDNVKSTFTKKRPGEEAAAPKQDKPQNN